MTIKVGDYVCGTYNPYLKGLVIGVFKDQCFVLLSNPSKMPGFGQCIRKLRTICIFNISMVLPNYIYVTEIYYVKKHSPKRKMKLDLTDKHVLSVMSKFGGKVKNKSLPKHMFIKEYDDYDNWAARFLDHSFTTRSKIFKPFKDDIRQVYDNT